MSLKRHGKKRKLIAQLFHRRDSARWHEESAGNSLPSDAELAAIKTLERDAKEQLSFVTSNPSILHTMLAVTDWDQQKAMLELADYQAAHLAQLPDPVTDPEMVLFGAENDSYTSCYIDSLLFAMFITLTSFDPLLTCVQPDQDSKQRLQMLLRLVVSKMRRGQLVKAQIMRLLREALEDTSWVGRNAQGEWAQEDASELFLFLSSTFHQPYLSFQRRLFHGGNRDSGDDRVMTERILTITIPPEPSRLQDILVDHFYNNVVTGIHRDVDYASTLSSPANSVFSKNKVEYVDNMKNKGPVTAWQVLELLPFYSSASETGETVKFQPQNSIPDTRIVLPIVLQRYGYDRGHQRFVKNTHPVQIPSSIHFNQFVNRNADDPLCATCGRKVECILKLQGAVCHKGESLQSGHYTAYACLEANKKPCWLKFDDLNTEQRVQALGKDEHRAAVFEELSKDAYILFYKLVTQCNHYTPDMGLEKMQSKASTSTTATMGIMTEDLRPIGIYRSLTLADAVQSTSSTKENETRSTGSHTHCVLL